MSKRLILASVFLAGCAGHQPKTVTEVQHLTCPPTLPPLLCDLGGCPDEHAIEFLDQLQESYLTCRAQAHCLAEHVGTVKTLHRGCSDAGQE